MTDLREETYAHVAIILQRYQGQMEQRGIAIIEITQDREYVARWATRNVNYSDAWDDDGPVLDGDAHVTGETFREVLVKLGWLLLA